MISMRASLATTLLLLLMPGVTPVASAAADTIDGSSWRRLPVLEAGRPQPFDTLARERLRAVANYLRMTDPETGEHLDACTLCLGMLLDWSGWDAMGQSAGRHGEGSPQIPYPDKWDRLPLLRVDFAPLRGALGLQPAQEHISLLELSQSKIRLPGDGEDMPLLIWTAALAAREPQELTPLERNALDLAQRFRAIQDWRAGRQLMIVPRRTSAERRGKRPAMVFAVGDCAGEMG